MSGWKRVRAYFTAPKRLSNEFEDTIGADPVTWASLAAGANAAAGAGAAAAVDVSVTEGFSAGLAAACLGSAGFGADAVARASDGAGSLRLASITFGFAGGGGALAGGSEPPRPTLRAGLEKNPSDLWDSSAGGPAEAPGGPAGPGTA